MKQCMANIITIKSQASATNKDLTSVPICKNHHTDTAIAGNVRVIIIIIYIWVSFRENEKWLYMGQFPRILPHGLNVIKMHRV